MSKTIEWIKLQDEEIFGGFIEDAYHHYLTTEIERIDAKYAKAATTEYGIECADQFIEYLQSLTTTRKRLWKERNALWGRHNTLIGTKKNE